MSLKEVDQVVFDIINEQPKPASYVKLRLVNYFSETVARQAIIRLISSGQIILTEDFKLQKSKK